MSNPVNVIEVLLLMEEKNSRDYGLALWAALHEADKLYNRETQRVNVRRFYFSPYVPSIPNFIEGAVRGLGRIIGMVDANSALESLQKEERVEKLEPASTNELESQRARIYDRHKLVEVIREQIARESLAKLDAQTRMLIITDQLIIPPPTWRYVIWDYVGNDTVISVAPLDPDYWGERVASRVGTIKDRTRVSVLANLGMFLRQERCANPRCYLYDDVDSVLTLDRMRSFGADENHSLAGELGGCSFDFTSSDPTTIQDVVVLPIGKPRGAP